MDRLGYTAMTAASRTLNSLQVHANNLANVNTPGFRSDLEMAEAVAVEGYGYDSRHMARMQNEGVSLTPGAVTPTGRQLDVAIQGSKIAAVRKDIPVASASEVIDAKGKLVVPGLIDSHVHARDKELQPPEFLSTGVTTMVDAGSRGGSEIAPSHALPLSCQVTVSFNSASGNASITK